MATDLGMVSGGLTRSPWRLVDLIDVDSLQAMQDTFARAFGVPTVIIDPDGTNATAITHRVRFCEDLTRASPVAGPRCEGCDRNAMRRAAATSEPAIFECWNGLTDCAIPIECKGQLLGYFLVGQVVAEPPDANRYRATAREIGVDPEEYATAVGDVKVVSFPRYEASVQSMHVLARMIGEQVGAAIGSLAMLEEARRARADAAHLVEELDGVLDGLRDVASQPDYQSTLNAVVDSLGRLISFDSCVIYLAEPGVDVLVPVLVRDPYPEPVRAHRPLRGRGIVGRVALGGGGQRFTDITRDPEFEPILGTSATATSALVVPMAYHDTVAGVIMLSRADGREFTDHELQLLSVFSSPASVSIQVSKLASENAQRSRTERALLGLLGSMARRMRADAVLGETARAGLDLLEADAAVAFAESPDGELEVAHLGIGRQQAEALVAALFEQPTVEPGARARVAVDVERNELLVPLGSGEGHAGAIFLRHDGQPWAVSVAEALSATASLALDAARLQEREGRLLHEYRRFSELGTELLQASDAAAVRGLLTRKTPGIVGGDLCFIAYLDQAVDGIAVELRQGPGIERWALRPDGGARVGTLRFGADPLNRPLFETWSQQVFDRVRELVPAASFIAEPLSVPGDIVGGIFVAWRAATVPASPEQRRNLGMLGSAACASLARFAAARATDSSLRERVLQLEALTVLAQRVTAETHEMPIVEELLAALRRIGEFDGAVWCTGQDGLLRVERASAVAPGRLDAILEAVTRVGAAEEPTRARLADGRHVVVVAMGGGDGRASLVAGIGRNEADDARCRVIATLARYGTLALEHARQHDRGRTMIARLESTNAERAEQYRQLQRILSIHETLARLAIEGRGLTSVARSLAEFVHAEELVVQSGEQVLGAWPPGSQLQAPPPAWDGSPGDAVVLPGDEAPHLVAAPAVVDGELLAWVVARLPEPPGDVERAAVEYGALLTSFQLLGERTAIEVETRLRGGFVEDLLREDAAADVLGRRALAFGFDLRRPARVLLIGPAAEPGASPLTEADALHGPVTECLRRSGFGAAIATVRANAVVVLVQAAADGADPEPAALEEELLRRLRARLPERGFNLVVGTLCRETADYRHSYDAARRGLELLRLTGRSDALLSFRANTVETMLVQANEPEILLQFIRRFVDPLDRYDRTHSSELRRTLETYYAAGGGLERAARALHVHVSTLRYRLERAGEVLGVDVRDADCALDIQVALRAARVLAVHGG